MAVLLSSILLSFVSAIVTLLVEHDPTVRLATLVFSLAVFCRGMSVWMEVLLVAHEKGRQVLTMTMWVRPFEPVIAVVLILSGLGIVGLASLHVALWGVQALVGLRILLRHVDMPTLSWNQDKLIALLRSGFPLMLGGAAMSFLQFGAVIVHRWIDGLELGQLSLLVQVIALLGVVPLSIMQTLLPALSNKMLYDERKALALPVSILTVSLLGGVLGASLVHPIWVAPVVKGVFGTGYESVAENVWISMVLVGMYGAGLALNQILILRKRFYSIFVSTLSGVIVFLVARTLLGSDSGDIFGLEISVTPTSTLACMTVGYLTWLVLAAIQTGLGVEVFRVILLAAIALVPISFLGGVYGSAFTLVLIIGGAWATGMVHSVARSFRMQSSGPV
jgi:O-antigen/teichoic acid export membrane protein